MNGRTACHKCLSRGSPQLQAHTFVEPFATFGCQTTKRPIIFICVFFNSQGSQSALGWCHLGPRDLEAPISACHRRCWAEKEGGKEGKQAWVPGHPLPGNNPGGSLNNSAFSIPQCLSRSNSSTCVTRNADPTNLWCILLGC